MSEKQKEGDIQEILFSFPCSARIKISNQRRNDWSFLPEGNLGDASKT